MRRRDGIKVRAAATLASAVLLLIVPGAASAQLPALPEVAVPEVTPAVPVPAAPAPAPAAPAPAPPAPAAPVPGGARSGSRDARSGPGPGGARSGCPGPGSARSGCPGALGACRSVRAGRVDGGGAVAGARASC